MTHAKPFRTLLWLFAAVFLLGGCLGDESDEPPEPKAAETAASAAPEAKPEPEPVCADCGRVTAVDKVTMKGEGSGAGAVGGAIVGVVVGNQIGSGSGKDIARIVGGIGGAVAGHEAEKRLRSETFYRVTVAMEAGGTQQVDVADATMLSVGDQVRVQGNTIVMR